MKRLIKTTSLKANIVANFIGTGWTSVLSLIFVPFYIRYIGAEGYGLIGLFASLQVILSLLDIGLSTTLNKELATLSAKEGSSTEMRNLVRTLETIYWGLALLIGLIAIFLSPILATSWVHPKDLSSETITDCFILLSISLIFQFPIGFYSGGLLGLQRHVHLNMLRIIFSTLKSVGALLVLIFYSHSVIAFFSWTLIISVLNALVIVWTLWHYLPSKAERARFDKAILKRIWRFAAGMSGIALTSVLLTQIDKIVLSKILPLDQFGYYSIAATLGLLIYQLVYPLAQSYFPKFSFLVSKNDFPGLKNAYHQGCQLISILIIPAALMLVFFSKELVLIWTNDPKTVAQTWEVVSFFAAGTAINGLLSLPFMLTLSHSWTRISFYTNLAMLVIMIPGYIFMSLQFGAVGAAACWTIVNTIYFFILPTIIHSRILKGETSYWYLNDVLKPLLTATVFILVCKLLFSFTEFSRWVSLAILVMIGLVAILLCIIVSREIRQRFMGYLSNIFIKQTSLVK
jgi:O-antigen/teichoic acid export membrane protein